MLQDIDRSTNELPPLYYYSSRCRSWRLYCVNAKANLIVNYGRVICCICSWPQYGTDKRDSLCYCFCWDYTHSYLDHYNL